MSDIKDQYPLPIIPEGNQQYKDKVDIQFLFNNQVQRCLLNLGSGYFPENVEALLRIIPGGSYDKILHRRKEWNPLVEEFEYNYTGPLKVGSIKKPFMERIGKTRKRYPTPYITIKDEEAGTEETIIDWTNPHIISPRLVEKEAPDYMTLFKIILQEAEDTGLSWKTEAITSEYGLYPKIEEDLGTQTPLKNPKKNEPQEQNPLHQICWINYKGTPKRVTNFRGYACGIGMGEKPWFFTDIAHRQRKQLPIVGLATAEQGAGKTYCVIRLAEILDKKFDPEKQIVMNRSDILKLVSGRGGLKRNQVIIIDEAQFGASSREWGKKDQIQLMKHLAAARFKGFVIFIVALHRSMLDNIIRDRLLTYHIHMEERGQGVIYKPKHQRFDENHYPARIGKLVLQLPDYDACDYVSCLDCDYDETCNTIRARYERKKLAFVESEAEKDAVLEQAKQTQEMSDAELCDKIMPFWGATPGVRTDVKVAVIESDMIKVFKSEYGISGLSNRQLKRLRTLMSEGSE